MPNDKWSITHLKNNPGMIAEKITDVAITNTRWRVIQRIDLSRFITWSAELRKETDIIFKLVTTLDKTQKYKNILNLLKIERMESDAELEDIKKLTEGTASLTSNRASRSIIPFIGSTLKFLFGTMSESDSVEIQKLIDANTNKSLSLSELLAKQIEIVSQEFKIVYDDIKKLKKFNDVLTDTIKDLYRDTEMKHMIDTTSVTIRKYSAQVSILTNAILFASKGAIHPRFVTAKTLGDAEKLATDTRPDLAYPSKLGNSTT